MATHDSEIKTAIAELKVLCVDIERTIVTFEQDVEGVYREMNKDLQALEMQITHTAKEYKLFEKGILAEMNHAIAGLLPEGKTT